MSKQKLRAGALALAFVIVGLTRAGAQTDRGRAVLERALEALGGRARIEAVATWDIEGRGRENLSAEAQGLAPGEPTWRSHEERLGIDVRTLSVAWQRRTPRNDMSLRHRRFIYKSDASGFVDFVGGAGAMRPRDVAEAVRRSYARRVPHLLLLEAATRATRVRHEGMREVEGRRNDVVSVVLPETRELTLLIDAEASTLSRVEYSQLVPTLGEVVVSYDWKDWKPDEALGLVPRGHRVSVDGVSFQEVTYLRFEGNSPDVDSLLEIPGEIVSTPRPSESSSAAPAAPLPPSGEVAPGVHVAAVSGFTVMFVELTDFVVAVEAPEAHPGLETIPAEPVPADTSERVVELIRSTVPGKPIRYVVSSHHHSDHMGGLRAFADAGATVIVAAGHESAARRTLRPSDDPPIETVTDRREITDGSRSVVIFDTGANPHTHENLFVWLPSERILFQGDLFYFLEGRREPPPGRETMNAFFAEHLRERGLAPLAIYGVHNRGAASGELVR